MIIPHVSSTGFKLAEFLLARGAMSQAEVIGKFPFKFSRSHIQNEINEGLESGWLTLCECLLDASDEAKEHLVKMALTSMSIQSKVAPPRVVNMMTTPPLNKKYHLNSGLNAGRLRTGINRAGCA